MSQEQEGRVVFLLWHSRPSGGHPESPDTDDKLLGVFDSQKAAEEARASVIDQPGFRDWPEAFLIDPMKVNQCGWTEGFISWEEAPRDLD